MSHSDHMRHLIDLANGKITETTPQMLVEEIDGSPIKNFSRWGKLSESEEEEVEESEGEDSETIEEAAWAGEHVPDSINVYQDKDELGSGEWFWTRSVNGHIVGQGHAPTEEEANQAAYGERMPDHREMHQVGVDEDENHLDKMYADHLSTASELDEAAPEVERIVGPAYWASYLVNGDDSGLEPEEKAAADAWVEKIAPYYVVDVARHEDGEGEDPRFTWSYDLHGGTARGGDVIDYICHKDADAMVDEGVYEDGAPPYSDEEQEHLAGYKAGGGPQEGIAELISDIRAGRDPMARFPHHELSDEETAAAEEALAQMRANFEREFPAHRELDEDGEGGGGVHVDYVLDIDELPEECIHDCSQPGDADEAVSYWVDKLNFTVDRAKAIHCLAGYGSWSRDELKNSTDEELAKRILWLACGNFAEWDGKEGDSNSGSCQFVLESTKES